MARFLPHSIPHPWGKHKNEPKEEKAPKPEKPKKTEKEKADEAAKAAKEEQPGPTAFVQIEGNGFNMSMGPNGLGGSYWHGGAVATYDFDLGYKFNKHFSADVGVPLYTTRTPFSIVTTSDYRYTTILGAPYLDIRYDTKHDGTNITSILTGAIGMSMEKTYSNGRTTVDWFNHFDREYQIWDFDATFSPFLNIGGGTGTVDRQVFPRPYELARPYETLGIIGNGEIGGAFTIHKHYRFEGSAYGLAPAGPQKVYSRIVSPDNLLGGDAEHGRYWSEFFETGGELVNQYGSGPSYIDKDNGWGAYFTLNRFKNVSLQLGYTKSIHYHYGSGFIMLRYNFTGILRNLTIGE